METPSDVEIYRRALSVLTRDELECHCATSSHIASIMSRMLGPAGSLVAAHIAERAKYADGFADNAMAACEKIDVEIDRIRTEIQLNVGRN